MAVGTFVHLPFFGLQVRLRVDPMAVFSYVGSGGCWIGTLGVVAGLAGVVVLSGGTLGTDAGAVVGRGCWPGGVLGSAPKPGGIVAGCVLGFTVWASSVCPKLLGSGLGLRTLGLLSIKRGDRSVQS
jgi:hypothetical protein